MKFVSLAYQGIAWIVFSVVAMTLGTLLCAGIGSLCIAGLLLTIGGPS